MEGKAVYLCEGLRTPIGRYGGVLSGVRPDDLLAGILKDLLASVPDCDPLAIEDCIVGCANQAGEDNRNIARMSVLCSGLPIEIPGVTVNRLCGSGLEAVAQGARSIASGEMKMILVGGVESMSRAPYVMSKAESVFGRAQQMFDTTMGWRFINDVLARQYGVESMPETAENLAEEYSISRQDQDAFALRSQQRTAAAQKNGRLSLEISPVTVQKPKLGKVIVDTDEHPRPTSMEKLAALPAPFRENGCVTAGNASGINDGAAAIILADEKTVLKYNLCPKARIVGSAVSGVMPRIMGIGPVFATQKLLNRIQWTLEGVDIIELNEAFAAQALAVLRTLKINENDPRVNACGGAIALGHPLGMSGTRLALSAAVSLQQSRSKRALCTLCIGVGQGIALAMERV